MKNTVLDISLDDELVYGAYRNELEPLGRNGIAINHARPLPPPRRNPSLSNNSHRIVAKQPLQSSLLHPTTTVVVIKDEQQDDAEEEQQQAWEVADVEESDEIRHRLHVLFDYLNREHVDRLRLLHEEIMEQVAARAQPMLPHFERQRERIERMIDAFLRKLLFDLLRQDKSATKVEKMMHSLEALFKARQDNTRGPQNESDFLNACIDKRCRDAASPQTDELYDEFSQTRRKGRRPNNPNSPKRNPVEKLASTQISPKDKTEARAGSGSEMQIVALTSAQQRNPVSKGKPMVDNYGVFMQTLNVWNGLLPKVQNHGAWLRNTLQATRLLDNGDWPLRRLMHLLQNMAYCVSLTRRITLEHDEARQQFFCCYSGELLRHGEEVFLIKLLERDTHDEIRTKLREKQLTENHFKTKTFVKHIHVFFMRQRYCALTSLFHQSVGENVAVVASTAVKKEPTRLFVWSPLAYRMVALTQTVTTLSQRGLALRHEERQYLAEKEDLCKVFEKIADETHFEQRLRQLLSFYLESSLPEADRDQFLEQVTGGFLEALLDWIDALWPATTPTTKHFRDYATHHRFLRPLLQLADRRRDRVNTFAGKEPCEVAEFRHFPFLFICLFAYLHQPGRLPALPLEQILEEGYGDAGSIKYLQQMNVQLK